MTDITLEAARKQKIHNLKLKTACLENEELIQEVCLWMRCFSVFFRFFCLSEGYPAQHTIYNWDRALDPYRQPEAKNSFKSFAVHPLRGSHLEVFLRRKTNWCTRKKNVARKRTIWSGSLFFLVVAAFFLGARQHGRSLDNIIQRLFFFCLRHYSKSSVEWRLGHSGNSNGKEFLRRKGLDETIKKLEGPNAEV